MIRESLLILNNLHWSIKQLKEIIKCKSIKSMNLLVQQECKLLAVHLINALSENSRHRNEDTLKITTMHVAVIPKVHHRVRKFPKNHDFFNEDLVLELSMIEKFSNNFTLRHQKNV